MIKPTKEEYELLGIVGIVIIIFLGLMGTATWLTIEMLRSAL